MKKTFLLAIATMMTLGVFADDQKKEKDPNEPVFTTIVANPITSIKNQARSGTCWAYSTLAFFESEILKKTKKNIDLCEMFVANKDYMDRAILKVRMHGDAQFSQGGSAYDVFYVLKNYGICPEDAMPLPGTMYGDTLNNFNQFFKVMESPRVNQRSSTRLGRLVSRVSSMLTSASALRLSPTKARTTLLRHSLTLSVSTGMTMYQSPATLTIHSTPSSL